jgi:hypothetical protein
MNDKSAIKPKANKKIPKTNTKIEDYYKNLSKKRERDEETEVNMNKKQKTGKNKFKLEKSVIVISEEDTPVKEGAKSLNKESTNSKSGKVEDDGSVTKQKESIKNRNSCSICRDGGNLILCDGCPKSFHLSCLKLKESDLTESNWYCANCIPKIERRNQRESEKDERRKIRNEKRRLYRKKKKEEEKMKMASTQQNNIININVIMNSKPDNTMDGTNNENTTMMNFNNINSEKFQDILNIFNKPNITDKDNEGKKKPAKVAIKYPLPDSEIYSNIEQHGIDKKCLTKAKGRKSTIAVEHFNKIIKIWDFINTYRKNINISTFTPELLYEALQFNIDEELPLINEIHISLLYIFLEELNSIDFVEFIHQKELLLLKVAIQENSSKRLLLNKTWTEVLRIISSSSIYELMLTPIVRDISGRLKYITPSMYNTLSYNNKVAMLEYLVDTTISTEFIKDIIKEHINSRNELNKEKANLNLELKEMESRKKELERKEKFTNPKTKIETLNKRLNTLVEDNIGLSRSELTKLRKGIEQEREEFMSVIGF